MINLPSILKTIKNELVKKEKIHEIVQESSRKATSLSKRAILLFHQERFENGEKLIKSSRELLSSLFILAKEHPEIVYSGTFSAALQEYSEACIIFGLIRGSRFVTPEEIGVPGVEYILGLADVIGEYRRLTLDAIRNDDVKKAEACLEIMDKIFTELMAMEDTYFFVPGLRRKCDIARRVIESTRGDITQEVRRKSLENYMRRFEQLRKK